MISLYCIEDYLVPSSMREVGLWPQPPKEAPAAAPDGEGAFADGIGSPRPQGQTFSKLVFLI